MSKFKSVGDCIRQGDGRYNADRSLYLIVRGGSALWEKQYRQGGRLKTKCYGSAVGTAPVSLTQARALDAADWLERRGQRQTASNAKYHNGNGATVLKSFSVARDEYFAKMQAFKPGTTDTAEGASPKWTDSQYETIKRMLAKHAAPLDTRPVGEITKEEVADMLRPKWKGPGSHTGNRVRNMVEKILRSAGIKNDDNPASWENLETELNDKVARSVPRASLPYAEVPAFMKELAVNDTMQAKALRFMVLTSTRQDEVLEATWGEFNLAERTWTIPGDVGAVEGRMKMDDAHKIWLSDAAMEILKSLTGGSGNTLVFPSKLGTRMAQQTIRELAKELRPNIKLTVHGFRSSMTTWAEEQGDGNAYAEKVILAAIAHYKGDANKRAYLRSKLFAPRKKLMADWCAFATS